MIGPLGEFRIPESPENTREHVRWLSSQVFAGEYDHAQLPTGVATILDIGCGWGAFAVWALTKWPQADLVGYDPHEEASRYFKHNAPWARHELAAVTLEEHPLYGVGFEWGSGHTAGRTDGLPVRAVHPIDLPPCDVMKIDAEGVEADVLLHYPHLTGVKTLLLEWHSPQLKAHCRRIVEARTQLRCVAEEAERDYGVSILVL